MGEGGAGAHRAVSIAHLLTHTCSTPRGALSLSCEQLPCACAERVLGACGFVCSFGKRKGVVINETLVVVYAQLLTGRKYVPGQEGKVHLEKQWAKQVLPHAYQTVVKVSNSWLDLF